MTIAYLDTIAGISGDMTLAAFVHAGVPFDELVNALKRLPLDGFELAAEHVKRNAIDAVRIHVMVSEQPRYHRHPKDIADLIDRSTLSASIEDRAKTIFHVLAVAEARVHNTSVERVHFHEVGAVDSIADIVGVAICLDILGIDTVYSSPVRLGSGGLIQTQHGTMPTPAPATLEILKGYPVVLSPVADELTTPTGAAIIKALSAGTLRYETLAVKAIGYGAGTKEFKELPNLLRVIVGTLPGVQETDEIVVIETNIDDMNPQVYPFLLEQLLAAGANDAYLIPIIMKKGRPGMVLSVMVQPGKEQTVLDIIGRESSSIGVRLHTVARRKLPRREVVVQTSFGPVKAKAVQRPDREVVTVEFEECRRIAEEKGLPLVEVMRRMQDELAGKGI